MTPAQISKVGAIGSLALKVVGGVSAFAGSWYALDLPVPATQAFVRKEIGVVSRQVVATQADTLENRLATIGLTKISLRNEIAAIERSFSSADTQSKTVFSRRKSQLEDDLERLLSEETAIRRKIAEIRP